MTELIHSLQKLLEHSNEKDTAILQNLMDLSHALEQENIALKTEVTQLQDIIQEVRRRDANKKCLCRGRS